MRDRVTETDDFLTAGLAVRVSGRTQRAIESAAQRGEIRTWSERGTGTRYNRADVLRFAGFLGKERSS